MSGLGASQLPLAVALEEVGCVREVAGLVGRLAMSYVVCVVELAILKGVGEVAEYR